MKSCFSLMLAGAAVCLAPVVASAQFVPGSLVAHYPMNESNSAVKVLADASGNGNDGYFTEGDTAFSFSPGIEATFKTTGPTINSVQRNSFEFNGIDDLLIVGESADFSAIATQGTISFWINTKVAERMSIMRGRNTTTGAYTGPSLEKTGSSGAAAYRIFFNPNVAQAGYFMAETLPVNNAWQHYVFVWDYSQPDSGNATNPNRVRCYVDGVQTTNRTASGASGDTAFTVPPTFGEIIMGGRFATADFVAGTYRPFNGEMAEIAIFNTAVDSTTAASLFSAGVNPAAPNLVAYYNFSEAGVVTTTADQSTNSNTMTVSRIISELPQATTAGQGPTFTAALPNGKPTYITQALQFDGTNDAVIIPGTASLAFPKDQGTFTMWTYVNGTGRAGIFGDRENGIVAQVSSSARMAFKAGNSGDWLQTTAAGTTVQAGVWVHYAFVFDRTLPAGPTGAGSAASQVRMKVYRNGTPLVNATNGLDVTWTTDSVTGDWVIGRRHILTDLANQRWLSGQLADMAIFNVPLSQSDIQTIVNDGVAGFLPADAPPTISTNNTLHIVEGWTRTIGSSLLASTDAEQGPASLTYSVTTAPTKGSLSASSFTQAAINSGALSYLSTGTDGSDSFEFTVSDGVNSPVTGTFNITIYGGIDTDRDGLPDSYEAFIGTNPNSRDTDFDGIEDGIEVAIGYNPLVAEAANLREDLDGDGIPDAWEIANGFNATNPDEDGDGFRDGYELSQSGRLNLTGEPALGDINGDDIKNAADATLILEVFLGVSTLAVSAEIADVNRDGRVDNVDAVILYQWSLRNINLLPFP